MAEHTFELLEELQQAVGCEYLSDLRLVPQYNQQAKAILLRMDPTKYSLRQWNDAVEYILTAEERTAEKERRILS